MKLTAKVVERLKHDPATGRQSEVKDDGTRGLFLRLYSSGHRSWIFRYKLRDQRRVIVLGEVASSGDSPEQRLTRGVLTLAEAREQAGNHAALVSKGEDPGAQLQKAKSERLRMPTVEEFAQEYIKRYSKLHNKNWKQNEQILAKWVLPEIGRLKLEDVHRRDVAALLDRCRDAGCTRQPGKILAVTRRMFRFAVERGVLDTSPVIYLAEKQPATTKRALTIDEIRRWWAIADDETPKVLRSVALALRLLLLTGQRPGEVAGLRIEELDLDARPEDGGPCWHIPGERRKREKPHFVALGPEAIRVINQALPDAQGGYLFPRARPVRDVWHPIRVDSGLWPGLIRVFGEVPDRPTPHMARHTVATELAVLGFDELEAALVLGHQSQGVTGKVYTHRRSVAKQRALIESWERRLMEILDEGTPAGNVVPIGARIGKTGA